ncbi:MAG: hypothetical protein R2713_16440 [Ilumatobacteraceae bacterium]
MAEPGRCCALGDPGGLDAPEHTVAIADDDQGVLAAITELFRSRAGWRVVGTAPTGDGLVDLVERECPLVVVSDVYLPGGDAPLFRRLDRLAERPQVVLAISACDGVDAAPAPRRRRRRGDPQVASTIRSTPWSACSRAAIPTHAEPPSRCVTTRCRPRSGTSSTGSPATRSVTQSTSGTRPWPSS